MNDSPPLPWQPKHSKTLRGAFSNLFALVVTIGQTVLKMGRFSAFVAMATDEERWENNSTMNKSTRQPVLFTVIWCIVLYH